MGVFWKSFVYFRDSASSVFGRNGNLLASVSIIGGLEFC